MYTRVSALYAGLMAVFAVGVFGAPSLAALMWAAIGLLSAGAVVWGTRTHAPLRAAPWWLLSAAIVAMATGDTIYGATVHGPHDAAPAITDVFYLAMCPLITLGLIQMTRTSVVLRDRGRLLDLLTFTCAAALLSWVFLVSPSLRADGLGDADKSTLSVYTIGDLLVLITSVRLFVAAKRSPAVILLAVGAVGVLVSDAYYLVAELGPGWHPGGPAELGYVLFYFCWGAAALQPSMVELTMPVDTRSTELRARCLVLLVLSLAVPPGVLLYESMTGTAEDAAVIAVTSVVMSALVITRLADAITRHRRAVARERSLREACGPLVAAADGTEVRAAVRVAVGQLMPPGVDHRIVFVPPDGPDMALAGPARPDGDLATARRTRLLYVRTLHPAVREELGGFTSALVCALDPDPPFADPDFGSLVVAGDQRVLVAMQDAAEVLAVQATQALERIGLSEAVNRHDSDQYVRTVVQNTADAVVIVDDDDRIRYASPSLASVLGAAPPPFATMRDIIHPDDHYQVAHTLQRAQRSADVEGARDCWSLLRPDGSRVLVEVSYRDLRQDRMVRGFVVTMRDITQRRTDEQELIRRALRASPAAHNRQSVANKFR